MALVLVPFLLVPQSSMREESDFRLPKMASACFKAVGPQVVSVGC